jgi:hypothetical protein
MGFSEILTLLPPLISLVILITRHPPKSSFCIKKRQVVYKSSIQNRPPASHADTLFRRVEIARPLRKTYGPTTALMEWKV